MSSVAPTPSPDACLSATSADWYDPQTGRFLSQDPIGLAGGVNLYAYAGNNPVSYGDPFGLCVPYPDCMLGWGSLIQEWDRFKGGAQRAWGTVVNGAKAVAGRVSVYARGQLGPETGRAEVRLDGSYAVRTQPEVSTAAAEAAVGVDVQVAKPPPSAAEIQGSYGLKAGKGPKAGWAITVTTAVNSQGEKKVVRVGVEYGGGIGLTPTGEPTKVGGGVSVPGGTCTGPACVW